MIQRLTGNVKTKETGDSKIEDIATREVTSISTTLILEHLTAKDIEPNEKSKT